MTPWVPPAFETSVLGPVRASGNARVTVQELVAWFGFARRGTRVNAYIHEALEAHGLVCTPALEKAFPNDTLTITLRYAPPPPPPPPPPPVATPELPHPFVVADKLIASQSEAKRVLSRLDALERACAYIVFAQLAALREPEGDAAAACHTILGPFVSNDTAPGPPISFGTWVELARRLSALRPAAHAAVAQVGATLLDDKALLQGLVEAVQIRNKLHHASNAPQASYTAAEPALVETEKALRSAMSPLFTGELVCVASTEAGETKAYRYRLRVLHGESTSFRVRHTETSHRMTKGWAYLELPGEAPLRLAPGIFCVEDAVTEQVQLFFCRTLALRPKQAVKLAAFVGLAEQKELLPT